jgi:hypothetical protein
MTVAGYYDDPSEEQRRSAGGIASRMPWDFAITALACPGAHDVDYFRRAVNRAVELFSQ